MKYSQVFPTRDGCRCFRLSVLFIHNGPGLSVIVAGRLWLSRPHSYLTLGPLHHLARLQKHIVSAFTAASAFQLRWPDAAQRSLFPARTKASGNCRGVKLPSGRNRLSWPCSDWMISRCVMNFIPFSFPERAAVEFGEEVADEHLLCGRVSRQLSAVGVVGLVRVFADMWTRG